MAPELKFDVAAFVNNPFEDESLDLHALIEFTREQIERVKSSEEDDGAF